MGINLYEHQKDAIEKLKSGSILLGGVGSGKSRTALAYYFIKECGGEIKMNDESRYSPMKNPKDLYIITTARKRDSLEWEEECESFPIPSDIKITIDSWNNINKYTDIKNAFFIFDEQRVVGSGAWVKTFLKICKSNTWILPSATPGDNWLDYIPVFIANGFYKNRTQFLNEHAIYKFNFHCPYPKIDRFVGISKLNRLRDQIIVTMNFQKHTIAHEKIIITDFDRELFNKVMIHRWNIYEERPIKEISEVCYLMRRVVNSDNSRLEAVRDIYIKHSKIIIFYNFDYELKLLLELGQLIEATVKQWNGHKHEPVPEGDSWIYLVQYIAGAEAWNCIETNVIVFYSQSYSYKNTIQAAGRIDRLNTPFTDLYYYYLKSMSPIDMAIQKALKNKRNFNENGFLNI